MLRCPSETLKEQLAKGLYQLGHSETVNTDLLLDYLALLKKWNRSYNLTAIRDEQAMVSLHLLDSLAIVPWLEGRSVLDVGTGAGLPGIPIAIARPDLKITLLDSCGKKTYFLQEVKRALGLQNIEVIHSRAETYYPPQPFETIICRALSEVAQILTWTKHLLADRGQWILMKGKTPYQELASISYPHTTCKYTVPFIEGNRSCVVIKPF